MKGMNKTMNLPAIQRIMTEFERESEIMDMKEEMMSDAIDDVMEDEADEEESETIVQQVLDEIGINLDQSVRKGAAGGAICALSTFRGRLFDFLAATPSGIKGGIVASEPSKTAIAADISTDDASLQARLDNLRKE
ncbi:MAG: Snf7-domain-containing protein [Olpidium bornovanus]|uniref:Snf7-domain-containing protein n=1 Tax=Olpidium bornovanus TaxID=278681 RepID=A0A8H8DFE0_9FUNG|nr:MAG: Snf7-domain-containing protein [Olpidium bornovanus]